MSNHWAFDLIGRPYEDDASGPDAFNCWGLVQWVFEHVQGVLLPTVAVGQHDNAAAIKCVVEACDWRPVAGVIAKEFDIATMTGLEGKHVGVVVSANGGTFLLHCIERVGVCLQPLSDLGRAGFSDITLWRRGAKA